MSDLSNPIGHRREQVLIEHLAEVGGLIDELKAELPNVNDAMLHPLVAMLIETGAAVSKTHGAGPKSNVADDLAALMSAVRALRIPARDPDLGRTPTLDRLRKSKGLIVAGLADALDAAAAIGLVPQRSPLPQELAANLPRAEIEGLLKGIVKRLENVESSLRALDGIGGEPTDFAQQQGLLNFYVGSMRVEIDIAKLHIAVGDKTVDIAAVARAVEAMTGLTRDFVFTVRAWTTRLAEKFVRIANELPKQVRTVASGVRATAYWAVRIVRRRDDVTAKGERTDTPRDISTTPVPNEPPPDFDLGRARKMILQGEAPPEAWRPFLTDLDFEGEAIENLSPLSGLVNLQRLSLGAARRVRDVSPLSGLAKLQRLDLGATEIDDLSALSGLANLRELNLVATNAIDIWVLSALPNLEHLYLSGMKVRDVSALSGLTSLQSLHLMYTPVSDISALSGLINLRRLDLEGTQVRDVSALSGLAKLEWLDVGGTQVRDLSPVEHVRTVIGPDKREVPLSQRKKKRRGRPRSRR
jgi:hypothetical protein